VTGEMSRLFFALWPDEKTRKQLHNVSNALKQDHFRQTRSTNLHITLVFLGEVSASDQLQLIHRIDGIATRPFQLQLTQIGVWPKPGILWLAPEEIPRALLKLVGVIQACVRQQGLKTDLRPYKPHVTLARKAKRLPRSLPLVTISWEINRFVLVASNTLETGVEYQVLQSWPLS